MENVTIMSDQINLQTLTNIKSRDNILLQCYICNKIFNRTKNKIMVNLKHNQKICCGDKKCISKIKNQKNPNQILNCKQCNKEFIKKYSQFIKTQNHFCSQTCSAQFNNRENPKRNKTGSCVKCGNIIKSSLKYCEQCKKQTTNYLPISHFFYNDKKRESKYTRIRQFARKQYLTQFTASCVICGYSHHIDVAHIKDIASYDPNTPINVVNNPLNLAGLCKNCHWELDHDILSKQIVIKTINKMLVPA